MSTPPYSYCVVESAGVNLILEGVELDAPAEDRALAVRFTGISFAVDDIVDAHRRPVTASFVFHAPPAKQFWGGTIATFEDPSGNQLQLVEY